MCFVTLVGGTNGDEIIINPTSVPLGVLRVKSLYMQEFSFLTVVEYFVVSSPCGEGKGGWSRGFH